MEKQKIAVRRIRHLSQAAANLSGNPDEHPNRRHGARVCRSPWRASCHRSRQSTARTVSPRTPSSFLPPAPPSPSSHLLSEPVSPLHRCRARPHHCRAIRRALASFECRSPLRQAFGCSCIPALSAPETGAPPFLRARASTTSTTYHHFATCHSPDRTATLHALHPFL